MLGLATPPSGSVERREDHGFAVATPRRRGVFERNVACR
jgi:hypothetical protein